MSVLQIIDSIILKPLYIIFEVIYMFANSLIQNPGLSIIVLSLVMNFLVLPLYRRADAMQEEERDMEARLHSGVAHIKKTFKGDEKMMILQTYYRQNNYKPTYVLKGAMSLFLEIPFFIAAYRFLSGLQLLKGVSFGPITDLGSPDGLLVIGTLTINILPIIMTAVNLVSCIIFTKGAAPKTKIQLYAMAVFFLFFLYTSPSGLVFYWTLNNIFSLVKTIFYKLKNPKLVLSVISTIVGVLAIISSFALNLRPKVSIGILVLGIILLLPLAFFLLSKSFKLKRVSAEIEKPDRKIFILGCVFMSVLIGLVIPLSLLKSSPLEFINVKNYDNPLIFVLSCFCISVGTFVLWFNIFYWLAENKTKKIFNYGIWVLGAVSIIDYMFFGKNLGILNSALVFENPINYKAKEIMLNAVIIIAASAVIIILLKFLNKHIFKIFTILTIALTIMVPLDIVSVNNALAPYEISAKYAAVEPSIQLSKNGKNVIVIMLDRAIGDYVPYIFNEKPELKEKYSGFISYSNTVSFAAATNLAAPAIYGGYEYTPEKINLRADEALVDKHNEALKVLPTLFSENDYAVTVCDPPYANYQWVPDLSIYNDNPKINKYVTIGKFADKSTYVGWKTSNLRNFFCYSVMKAAPTSLQSVIYNNGQYLQSKSTINAVKEISFQVRDTLHTAKGVYSEFTDSYDVLKNLPSLTVIDDSDKNTFMIMDNETTHETAMLKEPEYTPEPEIDNTLYDETHTERFNLNGRVLKMETDMQVIHYHSNVAAYLQLANFFDYLRQNGLYDNSRIILVSDHGFELLHTDDVYLGKTADSGEVKYDTNASIDMFHPILIVKDFDAKGDIKFSDEFMTTADVPSLATDKLIKDAKNPYTGNMLYNSENKENSVYIFESYGHDILVNNGNQFEKANWYSVVNKEIRKRENWINHDVRSVLPDYSK